MPGLDQVDSLFTRDEVHSIDNAGHHVIAVLVSRAV